MSRRSSTGCESLHTAVHDNDSRAGDRSITGYGAVNGVSWFGLTKRSATPKPESAKETETPAAPAKKRAPKSRRAGREPQPAVTESAVEAAPAGEAATA